MVLFMKKRPYPSNITFESVEPIIVTKLPEDKPMFGVFCSVNHILEWQNMIFLLPSEITADQIMCKTVGIKIFFSRPGVAKHNNTDEVAYILQHILQIYHVFKI